MNWDCTPELLQTNVEEILDIGVFEGGDREVTSPSKEKRESQATR